MNINFKEYATLYTGEETNNIPELMERAGEYYQKTLNTEIENEARKLEIMYEDRLEHQVNIMNITMMIIFS